MLHCPYCGAPTKSDVCEYCGCTIKREETQTIQTNSTINVNVVQEQPKISPRSNLTALLLCIFLGWLGFHRFYTGKVISGIVYMLTFGLFGLGILYDLILIACHSFKDHKGATLVWKTPHEL